MAVVGGEVMLCKLNSICTIKVYDRQIQYLRCIEHDRMGEISPLYPRQPLYVTDMTNSCIHAFSNNSVFLHSFGCDDNGEKMLYSPVSAASMGMYVVHLQMFLPHST